MKKESLLSNFSFEDVIEHSEQKENVRTTTETDTEVRITQGTHTNTNHINFVIKKNYGPLSDRNMAPIFSYTNWGGYDRYDLRRWKDNMSVPLKGISFTDEEIRKLADALGNIDLTPPSKNEQPKYTYQSSAVTAKIYDTVCVISEFTRRGAAWKKVAVWVDWNYGVNMDLRQWSNDYEKCGKGISITSEELKNLYNIIRSL